MLCCSDAAAAEGCVAAGSLRRHYLLRIEMDSWCRQTSSSCGIKFDKSSCMTCNTLPSPKQVLFLVPCALSQIGIVHHSMPWWLRSMYRLMSTTTHRYIEIRQTVGRTVLLGVVLASVFRHRAHHGYQQISWSVWGSWLAVLETNAHHFLAE